MSGRRKSKSLEQRFFAKIKITDHGLEWNAALDHGGYGKFYVDGRLVGAHRVAYQLWAGPIPAGMELDHLCRIHHCVTPDHLEPVTGKVNVGRGLAPIRMRERNPGAELERQRTHCPANHEYDDVNTYTDKKGCRHCRACARERERKRRDAKRVVRLSDARAVAA